MRLNHAARLVPAMCYALCCATLAAADRPATSAASERPAASASERPAAVSSAARQWMWPLAGAIRVTRPFDPPSRPWLPGHRGVDLAGAEGHVVYAAGSGVVRFAGTLAGRPVLSIDHAGGLRTTYEPVRSLVEVGRSVTAGQPIAVLTSGHSGCPAPACLHWGLRAGEQYLDPFSLLGLGRVRLLPVGEAAGPEPAARPWPVARP